MGWFLLIWAVCLGVFLAILKVALDYVKDGKHREFWGWFTLSVAPLVLAGIVWAANEDAPVSVRNALLFIVGGTFGGSLLVWVGYAFSVSSKPEPAPISAAQQQPPESKAMSGTDNRKGNFADINYGTQTYNEAPQQRSAPKDLPAFLRSVQKDGAKVQVRIYGMDMEMQTFGGELGNAFAASGFQTDIMNGDHGTRLFKGIVVEPAPNERSRQIAKEIAGALQKGGQNPVVNDGPDAWRDLIFIRVGIGGNG